MSARILKDLRSKAKDQSSAAAKDRRQLSKARVIYSDEVVCLRDEWERKGNKTVGAAAREKKKLGTTKQLAPGAKSRGKELKLLA